MNRQHHPRLQYIIPYLLLGCTVVAAPPDESNDTGPEPELTDDPELTGGGNVANGSAQLDTYLRALAPLDEPVAQALQTSLCPTAECGQATPQPRFGELSCRYDISRETQTASEDLVALGIDDDLWPGNVLRAVPARAGNFQSVPLPRAPRVLSTTLLGSTPVVVDAPSNSSYQLALTQLMAGQQQPSGSAVGSQTGITSVFSRESLSKTLSVDLSLPFLSTLGITLGVEARTSTEHATARVAVSFLQSYFRVVADAPTGPSQFFAPGVASDDVAAAIGTDDVPVYVRSVTYGRRVLAIFEDEDRSSDESLKTEVEAAFGGESAGAEIGTEAGHQIHYTRFSAMVLGDPTMFTTLDELVAYLQQPANVTTAWPIAYALNYVSDDTPLTVARTMELVTRSCEECGADDPSEPDDNGLLGIVRPGFALSDLDSADLGANIWSPPEALLLSGDDEDWYSFTGSDDSGVVDPQASLSSQVAGLEVCLFVDCLSGTADPECLHGEPAVDGTRVGCCSAEGDAQLQGATLSGLCLNGADDANVYVRVRSTQPDLSCEPYSLTMHY